MSKKPSLFELLEEYSNLFRGHYSIVSKEMETRLTMWMDCLRILSKCGNRTYSLLNLNNGKIENCFTAHSQCNEHPVIHLLNPANKKKLVDSYHRKDCYTNIETLNLMYNKLMSLPFEQRMEFVLNCLQRFKNKIGNYDIYLIRISVIEYDALGIPWILLIEAELLKEYNTNDFFPVRHFVLLNKENGEVKKHFDDLNLNHLTDQEFKVLKL